jgi:hypothetical protein
MDNNTNMFHGEVKSVLIDVNTFRIGLCYSSGGHNTPAEEVTCPKSCFYRPRN